MPEPSATQYDKPVVIVGAGVTGMTVAHLLAEAGIPIVLIEKEDALGGLARSFQYGDFVFDVGPHRFHTDDPNVTVYLERLLADQSTLFPRTSEVYFQGDYYRWPLHPRNLVQLPPMLAVRSGMDLLANTVRNREIRSFEDYVIRQFGPTLYDHFFRDYSIKFVGIHPSETHPDWAKAGLNRAIIDDKLQMQNLTQLLKSTLLQFRQADIDFIYPRFGMHLVWSRMAESIRQMGGRIITGANARMEARGDRVTAVHAGEDRFEPSQVVWTGTVNEANDQLRLPALNLPYRSLLLFNVMVNQDVPRNYQWCYYGARDLVFSRISIPRHFSGLTCPPGTTGLCVEITCMAGDLRWTHGEKLTDWVVDDLVRVGMVPHRRAVEDIHMERVYDAYPIYHIDYPQELGRAQNAFGRFSNLHMAGRNGTFWYNNMDHCVDAALSLVKRMLLEAGVTRVTEETLAQGPETGPQAARA